MKVSLRNSIKKIEKQSSVETAVPSPAKTPGWRKRKTKEDGGDAADGTPKKGRGRKKEEAVQAEVTGECFTLVLFRFLRMLADVFPRDGNGEGTTEAIKAEFE